MTLTTYTHKAITEWLGDKSERPARYATTVRHASVDGERNGCVIVRHHRTDIITVTPSTDDVPVVQLDTGGWHSVTTCARLNDATREDHGAGPLGTIGSDGHGGWVYTVFGPQDVPMDSSYRPDGTWFAYRRAYTYAFVDGMTIDTRPGETYGHPMPAHRIPVDRNGSPLNYAGPGPMRDDDTGAELEELPA